MEVLTHRVGLFSIGKWADLHVEELVLRLAPDEWPWRAELVWVETRLVVTAARLLRWCTTAG